MLPPSRVVTVPRAPGVQAGVTVVLGAAYTGALVLPQKAPAGPAIVYHSPQDAAQWSQLAQKTRVKVRMPTAWVPGYSYDWSMSRTYTIPTGHGNAASMVVVGAPRRAAATGTSKRCAGPILRRSRRPTTCVP